MKKAVDTTNNAGNVDINFKSNTDHIGLRGIVNIMPDSSFISIFGPLGISLVKMRVKGDSISVVDIQHKTIYTSFKKNSAISFYNIFNGQYSQKEEQLVCSLCYVMNKDFSRLYCSKDVNGNSGINFEFNNRIKKKFIKFTGNSDKNSFVLDLKFVPSSNNRNYSFSLTKYSNFQNISLKLQ